MNNCPTCGCSEAVPVHRVAWGGFVAPRLYRLQQCEPCGTRYSARTGQHESLLVPGYVRGVLLSLVLVLASAVAIWWLSWH